MDIVPLVTAFTLILFSELGDKTQLAVMALSSKASAFTVLAGTMLAFFLVDGLSLLLGGGLLCLLPHKLVGIGAGLLFIAAGAVSLVRSGKRAEIEGKRAT